jgi:succinate dehydrogenase flavin-adding protein (antitoxin of CptAB toxin-antitoxin module)
MAAKFRSASNDRGINENDFIIFPFFGTVKVQLSCLQRRIQPLDILQVQMIRKSRCKNFCK